MEVSSGLASTRPLKKLSTGVKPAHNSKVRMLQHPSHLHPHHLAQGRWCATDIFMLEGVDHLVVGNFYSKMIFVWHIPPGQSNAQQGHLAAEGDVIRAWHPQSPSLWQWPTICKYLVCWLLYSLGQLTQNLKSTLPTVQQICQGMCASLPNMHSNKPSIVVLIHTLLC